MFNNNTERTPAQQATRATLGVIARLGCAIYILTFIYKIWTSPDRGTAGTIIGIVMLVADLVLLVLTIIDTVRMYKNGAFKEEHYYTEEYLEKVHQEQLEYAREHPDEAADMGIDLAELEKKPEEPESADEE